LRQSYRGRQRHFALDAELATALCELGRKQGATEFMVLLAGFALLLGRYAGQSDIVIGTPAANRDRPELADVVGFLVNLLALRLDLYGNPTVMELLERSRAAAVAAYVHQEMPFDKVVQAINPVRSPRRSPLFQVCLAFEGDEDAPCFGNLVATEIAGDLEVSKFDLTLIVRKRAGALECCLEYSTDLFDALRIDRLAEHFERLLRGMIASPGGRVEQIEILGSAERDRVVEGFNRTDRLWGAGERTCLAFLKCIARERGEACAVEDEDKSLSYRELWRRSDELAAALQARGVGRETVIGLWLGRSVEFLVAMLGIWKAGGAYVSLDPACPQSRLEYIVGDCRPALVLTGQDKCDECALAGVPCVSLASVADAAATGNFREDSEDSAAPEDLAYVLYTSSSIGRPTGVMVEHGGLLNLALACADRFAVIASSRVLQHASPNSDLFLSDILAALVAGATLVMPGHSGPLLGANLETCLRRRQVSHLAVPPSVLASCDPAQISAAISIIVGGEACPQEIVDRWAAGHRLINAYGATEATVWSTLDECRPGESVTIGRPISNVTAYVVDAEMRPSLEAMSPARR
jgi:non-ribosomal peptide synthetase component F